MKSPKMPPKPAPAAQLAPMAQEVPKVAPAKVDEPVVQNTVAAEKRKQRMRSGHQSTILSAMNEASKQTLG